MTVLSLESKKSHKMLCRNVTTPTFNFQQRLTWKSCQLKSAVCGLLLSLWTVWIYIHNDTPTPFRTLMTDWCCVGFVLAKEIILQFLDSCGVAVLRSAFLLFKTLMICMQSLYNSWQVKLVVHINYCFLHLHHISLYITFRVLEINSND